VWQIPVELTEVTEYKVREVCGIAGAPGSLLLNFSLKLLEKLRFPV